MKTNKLQIFALLTLGGLIALGPIARADDAPATPAPSTNAPATAAGHADRHEQMDKLFTAINATDAEKEQLKPIFKERNEKLKALRDDTSLSQEDRASKRKELNQKINAKVKTVLTADQFEEYQKFQKAQGRRNRQSAPPADAPPKN